MRGSLRSLALAVLALSGCPQKARPAPALDARASDVVGLRVVRADAGAPSLAVAARPAGGPLRCAFEGPDRLLERLAVTRLRIAARGDEAMLVAEYTSAFAPEPAGDSVDEHASRWWLFDLAHPERDTRAQGQRDALDVARSPGDGGEPSACGYAKWGEDAERPVWDSSRWTRWRHASAWGGPACSPCGTIRASVDDARGVLPQVDSTTDVMTELEVSAVAGFRFGAALLKRYDYRGPVDDSHNVCSEVGVVIESVLLDAGRFERRELWRARMGDDNEPLRLATAATNAGETDGVIVTVHGAQQQRIELRRVDRAGRLVGQARVVHRGENIGDVAVAYLGSQLVLVWSESATPLPDARPSLRWLSFDPRDARPWPPARVLRESAESAVEELSLASDGATVALVWVERSSRGLSVARLAVGASLGALDADVTRGGLIVAQPALSGAIYASSAAVAGGLVWVAFNDPMRRGDTRPRVRSLRCAEAQPDR